MKNLTKNITSSAVDKQLLITLFFNEIEVNKPKIYNPKTKRFKLQKAD